MNSILDRIIIELLKVGGREISKSISNAYDQRKKKKQWEQEHPFLASLQRDLKRERVQREREEADKIKRRQREEAERKERERQAAIEKYRNMPLYKNPAIYIAIPMAIAF